MKRYLANAAGHASRPGQSGGALLGVVATLGVILAIVQGGLYYQSRTSARFLGAEKKKIMSLQMAEAGIEENIADMGSRKLRVEAGLTDTVTYTDKSLGAGSFTTRLITVGMGFEADTVDLLSTGAMSTYRQSVTARLRLKKYLDTTRTPISFVAPETTLVFTPRTVPETTFTIAVQDPNTLPAFNTTPAYDACMSSSAKKCDVCHLPGGDVSKANVINVSKSSINTHTTHHGDYVTTDGSCDVYKPKSTIAGITSTVVVDTILTILDKTVYDSKITVDTAVKVQILSWK